MPKATMNQKPWHHEGLRFACTGCGACCTGDPGYVWVNAAEIRALASVLGVERAAFEATFLRRVGRRWSLVELASGDCVFFDRVNRRCRVYDARPRQCRTWPFWRSNLRTEADWEATCRICPGAGRGPIVPREEIEARLAAIRI